MSWFLKFGVEILYVLFELARDSLYSSIRFRSKF